MFHDWSINRNKTPNWNKLISAVVRKYIPIISQMTVGVVILSYSKLFRISECHNIILNPGAFCKYCWRVYENVSKYDSQSVALGNSFKLHDNMFQVFIFKWKSKQELLKPTHACRMNYYCIVDVVIQQFCSRNFLHILYMTHNHNIYDVAFVAEHIHLGNKFNNKAQYSVVFEWSSYFFRYKWIFNYNNLYFK